MQPPQENPEKEWQHAPSLFWEFAELVMSKFGWLLVFFFLRGSALLRSFALSCLRFCALFCTHLGSFAPFCVRPRFRMTPHFNHFKDMMWCFGRNTTCGKSCCVWMGLHVGTESKSQHSEFQKIISKMMWHSGRYISSSHKDVGKACCIWMDPHLPFCADFGNPPF